MQGKVRDKGSSRFRVSHIASSLPLEGFWDEEGA
jgi:hypothetical protein